MYLNLFKTWEALPLRSRRILPSPNLRRFSGGIAAGSLPGIRWQQHGAGNGIPADHPSERLAKLPGNVRVFAEMMLTNFRSVARQTSAIVPQQWRRIFGEIAAAVAGKFPITFPSYARH